MALAGSLGVVFFAYFGYPVLIFGLSRLFGRRSVPPAVESADLPAVSLLIAAYNEEVDIEDRVRNALALQYPPGKLEIVIASDGSTDRTNEIVRRYADRGVRLIAYPENRGKATVLNRSVPRLAGEILILSDAAVRLAAWFADPRVGVVCGRLVLSDPQTGKNVDGLYWKYETFLKKCESRLGALLGSNGAIYAIRKTLFPVVQPGTLIDDFVIPLEARRASGCRIVYDDQALAREETPPTLLAEFRRRVRIGAGGFQSIGMLWRLLSPANGWIALTFFCHKILRWSCPFFLIAALAANAVLLDQPGFAAVMFAQLGFYVLAAAGHWLPRRQGVFKLFRLPTMFVTMNLALFFGFIRWARGRNNGTWRRTDRSAAVTEGSDRQAVGVGA
jgi:cellulose synthase/poly-beta-1,6-N-acetylglucosamine synthase-like glycosyltransferase